MKTKFSIDEFPILKEALSEEFRASLYFNNLDKLQIVFDNLLAYSLILATHILWFEGRDEIEKIIKKRNLIIPNYIS